MKLSTFLISFLTFFLISFSCFSQKKEQQPSLNGGTIESQFDYLYKKSPKWEDYKSVKINNLFKFKNNVTDSLKLARKKFSESQNTISIQNKRIDSLKLVLQSINVNLTKVTKEKDSIKLFGISMSKASYNSLLWFVIIGLTTFLIVFISKFKKSNAVTVDANKSKFEIEQEYESHRQRSLDREQKLRRELQDELNRQKYAKQNAARKKK
jgi:hypothetical protein